MDRYKQKWPKMLVRVQKMDLYEHPPRADPSEPVSGRENPAVRPGSFACTGSFNLTFLKDVESMYLIGILVLNLEVVEQRFVVVLCREAGIGEIAVDMAPFAKTAVVE